MESKCLSWWRNRFLGILIPPSLSIVALSQTILKTKNRCCKSIPEIKSMFMKYSIKWPNTSNGLTKLALLGRPISWGWTLEFHQPSASESFSVWVSYPDGWQLGVFSGSLCIEICCAYPIYPRDGSRSERDAHPAPINFKWIHGHDQFQFFLDVFYFF